MEQKSDENSNFKTGSEHQVLKKILYDKDTEVSSTTTNSSCKKSKESKMVSSDLSEKSPEKDDIERPSSTTSPEPNCPICLEPLQNKSFTDSCCHQFCFTCLLEWSKVKAECPLCKQQFKSIVHNLQKDNSFDEYVIASRTSRYLSYFRAESHRYRYSTALAASRILERNRLTYEEAYQNQITSHRMRFAPHSVNMYSSAQIMSRLPCPFRRRVYEQNLWVKTSVDGRTRIATPEFYKCNPACTHRLIPWLNRELVSLWHDNDATVSFVLELIMSLIVRYHINSQEFLIHLEPYMGRNTHHFIHEFHAFAISPYDMDNYDALADYGLVSHSTDDAERSSPDSDVIAIYTGNPSLPRQIRDKKKMQKRALKHLKMILKKNNGNNWESYLSPASSSFMSSSSWSNPGPSTSRANNFPSADENTSNFTIFSDIDQTDDEIEVVEVVKPQAERTPVIVDLSSDEEHLVTVINVSSGEENFSPVCSPSRTPPLAELSVNDASSDIECVLEYQASTSRDIPNTREISIEKDTKLDKDLEQEQEVHHNSTATEDLDCDSDVSTEEENPPKLASAIVRPLPAEIELARKKRVKRYYSSSSSDDSKNKSVDCEFSHSGSLKLRSVVAHFDNDHHHKSESEKSYSSHHSSRKRHKEKKKRKKQKKHKRSRNRMYLGSEYD